MSINIESAPFGGIRVEAPSGVIAVNAGGDIEEMEKFYAPYGNSPVAMVLTCEHRHRSRNAEVFAEKHGIPLIGSFLAFAQMHIHVPEKWEIFPPRKVVINQITLDLFHVKYDSVDPLELTVSAAGESVGIIPDGKLTGEWPDALRKLKDCQEVFFGNKMDCLPQGSNVLRCRYRNCYNTGGELTELFRDYQGKMVVAPYCH